MVETRHLIDQRYAVVEEGRFLLAEGAKRDFVVFAVGADEPLGFFRRMLLFQHAFDPLGATERARAFGFLRAWTTGGHLERLATLANHPEGDFDRGDEEFPV